MKTIVRFRTGRGEYALPVEQVSEVRRATDLTLLPAAQPGVAGIIRRGDEVVTVLSVLGDSGDHVVVIDEGGQVFGLLVDEVTGVHRIDEADVGPAPGGHDGAVAGAIIGDDGVVLMLDAAALRGKVSS